jgi:signal peptidase I
MLPSRVRLLTGLRWLTVTLVLLLCARLALFTTYRVSGSSMLEALHDGDRILVGHHQWLVDPLESGDAVVLEVDGEVLVKRIVACPGDVIAMQRGRVMRNGSEVREDIPAPLNRADSFPDYRLGSDEYFVLGDHRRVSIDSRDFGPVSSRQVLGRVFLRMSGRGLSAVSALEREEP